MKDVIFFAVCAVAWLNASAQPKADGSIAIAEWSKDEIAVAADSRQSGLHSYSDTGCKISAFGNKLVFVATGRSRPADEVSWDVYTVASEQFHRLAAKGTPNRFAERLAISWGQEVKRKFEQSGDTALIGLDDDHITTGLFADFERNGSLLMVVSAVTYQKLTARTIITARAHVVRTPPGSDFPFFLGHADIVAEALAAKTTRGAMWRRDLENRVRASNDQIAEEAIALVDLTIVNLPKTRIDTNGVPFSMVGPPITAVRLVRNNGITWIAKGKCAQ